jgi:hypothetical protein
VLENAEKRFETDDDNDDIFGRLTARRDVFNTWNIFSFFLLLFMFKCMVIFQ